MKVQFNPIAIPPRRKPWTQERQVCFFMKTVKRTVKTKKGVRVIHSYCVKRTPMVLKEVDGTARLYENSQETEHMLLPLNWVISEPRWLEFINTRDEVHTLPSFQTE